MHTFRFSKPKGEAYLCYFSREYFDVKSLKGMNLDYEDSDPITLDISLNNLTEYIADYI